MSNSFIGLHSAFGIPPQAPCQEIEEGLIIAFENLLKCLRGRTAAFAFTGDLKARLSQGIKEDLLARTLLDQMLLRRPKDLHDAT